MLVVLLLLYLVSFPVVAPPFRYYACVSFQIILLAVAHAPDRTFPYFRAFKIPGWSYRVLAEALEL